MSDSNPVQGLSQLIRPYSGGRVPSQPRSFTVYRAPNGRLSRRRPIAAALFASGHSAWLVAPSARVQIGPKVVPIQLGNASPFYCIVTCSVRSISENDRSLEQLLDVASTSATPEDGFWRWIGEQLHELGDRHDVNDSPLPTSTVREGLERAALDQLGIAASMSLAIEGGVRTLELNPPAFSVHVRDSEESLDFRFEMGVRSAAKRSDDVPFAGAATASTVQKAAIDKVLSILSTSCSMELFMLHPADVTALLREHGVHTPVEALGYEITSLRAYPRMPFEVDLPSVVRHTVKSSVQPGETEVLVNHQLRLTLDRPETLLRRRGDMAISGFSSREIESWVRDILEDVTETALIGLVYIDLLMDFEETRSHIEKLAAERFGAFGFSVNQHITKESLPLQDVLEHGFKLSWTKIKFNTADGRVAIVLDGYVEGKEPSRELVRNRLRPDWDYAAAFEATCTRAIAGVIRRLQPETLYLYFDSAGSLAGSEEELGLSAEDAQRLTPRQFIESSATEAMRDEYGVKFTSVRLTQAEDRFAKRYDALRSGANRKFAVGVMPYADAMERTPYFVEYRITGVSEAGWPAFQRSVDEATSTEEHANQIGATLSSPALAVLKTLGVQDVNYQSFRTNLKLRSAAFREGIEHVREFFGLEVAVLSLDRGHGVADRAKGEIKREAIRGEVKEVAHLRELGQQSLRELLDKERDLVVSATGQPEELKELEFTRDEIKRVRESLAPFEQTGSALISHTAAEQSAPTTLDELEKLSAPDGYEVPTQPRPEAGNEANEQASQQVSQQANEQANDDEGQRTDEEGAVS